MAGTTRTWAWSRRSAAAQRRSSRSTPAVTPRTAGPRSARPVETARADLGVQIDLDPTPMTPPSDGDRAPTLVVKGTCTYPNGRQATLVLCKLAMPIEVPASWDVAAWATSHTDFPDDTTAQQLYGDREFEAYRRLGELRRAGRSRVLRQTARPSPRRWPQGAGKPSATPTMTVPPARHERHVRT